MSHAEFIRAVAQDVQHDAAQRGRSLVDALHDWEGYGPNGSFGLKVPERAEVAIILGVCLGCGTTVTGFRRQWAECQDCHNARTDY